MKRGWGWRKCRVHHLRHVFSQNPSGWRLDGDLQCGNSAWYLWHTFLWQDSNQQTFNTQLPFLSFFLSLISVSTARRFYENTSTQSPFRRRETEWIWINLTSNLKHFVPLSNCCLLKSKLVSVCRPARRHADGDIFKMIDDISIFICHKSCQHKS